jgi:DNA-binding transcriptional MerR regulator
MKLILAIDPGQPHTVFRVTGLLSVGQLARRAGLTTKALRHYDRIGLLHPAEVDAAGYRWYDPAQVHVAHRIAVLRSVDVPIDEIRRCLDDDAAVTEVLKEHRRRLESRLTRVQRDLHNLDHFLADGWEKPMATALETMDPEAERKLAAGLFNETWTYMEKENRTRDEDDAMLHMAHASRHHWAQIGKPQNFARGEWQCSRVYALLRRPEPCLHHARRVLEICEENGIGDWDLAYAYEALARAHAVAGDAEAAEWKTKARAAGDEIADAEDREHFDKDYATLSG